MVCVGGRIRMSQQQAFGESGPSGAPNIEFVEGNDSVVVGPDPTTHILQILGDTTKGVTVDNTAPYQETVSVAFATTSTPGVASLNPTDFTVTSGEVSLTAPGFNWSIVTSISPVNPIQIVQGDGYICNGSSQVTFILPLAPVLGPVCTIISNTATFQITENGSQQIRIGAQISTAGSGTATSNTIGDVLELIYVGSNIFICKAPEGIITLN